MVLIHKMYLSTLFFLRFLFLEGTLYKFATNSQSSSYSKLHLRQVHHIFFSFQRKPINGANYICTKCTQVACWLQIHKIPCVFPTHYIYHVRASSEEKYHVLAFTFKTVIHKQQMLWSQKITIHKVGSNTGRLSIYIAQSIYIEI